MDKSPLTTGPIHRRPKITGSLGEQLLRLANIASCHSPSEELDPGKSPDLVCSLGEQFLRLAKLAKFEIFGPHFKPIRSPLPLL